MALPHPRDVPWRLAQPMGLARCLVAARDTLRRLFGGQQRSRLAET